MQENACSNETPEDWPYISDIKNFFFQNGTSNLFYTLGNIDGNVSFELLLAITEKSSGTMFESYYK